MNNKKKEKKKKKERKKEKEASVVQTTAIQSINRLIVREMWYDYKPHMKRHKICH